MDKYDKVKFYNFRNELGPEYTLLKSETLSAMNILVFAHNSTIQNITEVYSATVKTGFSNLAGNKGAVAVTLKYKDVSFLFIGAHLSAGQFDVEKRNQNFLRIMTEMNIGNNKGSENVRIIDKYNASIFMGDLNYRVNIDNEAGKKVIKSDSSLKLLEFDQLSEELSNNICYQGLHEGIIDFNPTYRLKTGKPNQYDFERIPSWTDRILYKSKGNLLTQLKYNSINTTYTSDHKPVYSLFKFEIIAKKNEQPDYKELRSFNSCIMF
jgi:hypothetical protein